MNARAIAWSPGAAGPLLADDDRWWRRAACLGADTAIFFPRPGASSRTIAAAKAFCARCPVRGECLADALKAGDRDCIRGGTTWPERRDAIPSRDEWCRAGLHRRIPENTYTDGKCRPCRLARAPRGRADERVARTGSSSPQYGKRAA